MPLDLLGLLGWAVAFGWWWAWQRHVHAHEVTGCLHKDGKVVSMDHHITRNSTYLIWQCSDCRLQAPLRELIPLPGRDTFWYTRGREMYSEDHLKAIEEIREDRRRRAEV